MTDTPIPQDARVGSQDAPTQSGAEGLSSEELLPLVYDELRRMAHAKLDREGDVQTLQATALVHEVYLRFLGKEFTWQNRAHFFAAAANSMRRILVDRARARKSTKRGGRLERTPLDLVDNAKIEEFPEQLIALDTALEELERRDERKARVVMLRFFAGLTLEDTAQALDVSLTTVKEDWSFARAWLYRAIS